MPRFAANLSMLYPELDFLDRFAAAARDGFAAVEFLFGYAWPKELLAGKLGDAGLQCVLINSSPGDFEAGDRGYACRPGNDAAFERSIEQGLEYARALGAPRLHVMAGLVPTGLDPAQARGHYVRRIAWAARQAAAQGCDIMIEPINTRDMPGYFLNYQQQAHDIAAEIGEPNVKVQMDLYHCQIMEGDLASKIRRYLPTGRVGHFQIAGVPDRHEPSEGEVRYAALFDVIDDVARECGWEGWVGAEYRPRGGANPGATSAGLGWLR